MISVKAMLLELISAGWSQSSIARALDTTQPTIHRIIEKGSEPGYELGKRIENLHQEEMRRVA